MTTINPMNIKLQAQVSKNDNGLLRINVQVTNNGNKNLIGSIHVISHDTDVNRNSNNITFPAGRTITKIFEANSEMIPSGAGFSVEVEYGDNHSIIAYSANNQNHQPKYFHMNIP
ncbi:MAG TPA: hypothetical protein VJU13_03285 [Candidatus Nitrosocosmicus sp.]|nr:hypothetical protein [Candidatus Nitrosocosmicus sp.]